VDLGLFGWIIVGLIAGALAGFFVPGRERFGCLGTMLIGILGGLIGGWLWTNVLHMGAASSLIGAIFVATLGSILVLLVIRAMTGNRS
jgi:uncharacterized membrane protein YeaQ/YmgE (transglycosylase-associated protein family)